MPLPKTLFVSCTLTALSAALTLAREFEDHYGRVIEAELISHSGAASGVVEIAMGGKNMNVKVDLFSEKDRRFIKDWMAITPPKLDYAFRANIIRKVVKPTGADRDDSDDIAFDVSLTNLTRHSIDRLRVEYRAYMLDHEPARDFGTFGGDFGRRRAAFTRAEPQLKYVEDALQIEEPLRYNQDFSFTTKAQRIDLRSDDRRDEALGVIVRVYAPGGKLVFEYRDKKAEDFEWETAPIDDSDPSVLDI